MKRVSHAARCGQLQTHRWTLQVDAMLADPLPSMVVMLRAGMAGQHGYSTD